ncbi:MAG: Maf-like protein YhdE [Candidatus Dichloromethanomonas elyunquensis]|nr:MAG: Maf-like protein YhdE [Candidatus Dichloromethanomonas elyunquensis]
MLVLASSSPRRKELLQEWGYEFGSVNAPVSEELEEGIVPETGVQELARRKAFAGYEAWRNQDGSIYDMILSADTIVVLDQQIFGKPFDNADAERMLRGLSGKTHKVMTGIALAGLDHRRSIAVKTYVEVTIVSFRNLDSQEILNYIASGEPMDKAAAYGIQGEAGKFAAEVKGSYTNVIGLPMELLSAKLKERGIFPTHKYFRQER